MNIRIADVTGNLSCRHFLKSYFSSPSGVAKLGRHCIHFSDSASKFACGTQFLFMKIITAIVLLKFLFYSILFYSKRAQRTIDAVAKDSQSPFLLALHAVTASIACNADDVLQYSAGRTL